jgi:heptosyltransferase-1
VKILIIKPSSLGDVIQALPVLRLLKRQFPESEIHWWVEASFAALLEGDPDLAGIVRFERRRWRSPLHWPEFFRTLGWVRRQQFDLVLDLQALFRSAVFAWAARGKLTMGLDDPREGAPGFYDRAVPRPVGSMHAVDWYLAVLPELGVPQDRDFQWLPERFAVADALRKRFPVAASRWIVLQPGARWPTKRWPVEYFAELTRHLAATYAGFRFAILGGAEDRALGQAIAGAGSERFLDLTGQLSLPEMVEWIRFSELMVSNDTGPMHAAAALGRPVVALFGPTDPQRTGPYGQTQQVLQLQLPCIPCRKPRCSYVEPFKCLRALPVGAAFDAVRARI